ncbi:MAG: hypothetical protein Q8T08_01895 [Ignavibacteria bacterium]|nr:hypothetical protein [Ignavibacteria bacterium]
MKIIIKNDLKKGIQQSLNLSIEERMEFIANLIIDKLEIESSANTASVDEKIVVEYVSK